ncbi:MAG: 7-cyano-7-deazaguanine synthase QueC [Kiritimatiellia bacterium]
MSAPLLVIFSGGQDSTTCLMKAIAERGAENVHTVTFDYGQRHVLEVKLAQEIAEEQHIASHKVITVDWYKKITHNALLDTTEAIQRVPDTPFPNTFVEGRNALFLLTAAIYAKSKGILELMIGVGDADYSGYPDCREAFVKSMNQTLNLAMDCTFIIHAPLQHLTKAQTWALADQLGCFDYIRTRTLTCYEGIRGVGCGQCPACKLRAKGLAEYLASQS